MWTSRLVPVVILFLGCYVLAGCDPQTPAGPEGATSQATEKASDPIPVEEVADRLVSEAILFSSCVKGNNAALVAGVAGRLDLPLEERLARAWKSNELLELVGDNNQLGYGAAPLFDLMAHIAREFATTDEAEAKETVKSLASKIRFETLDKSKRDFGGNPDLMREKIVEEETKFNQSLDEEGARQLVQRQKYMTPRILNPIRPDLPKLRAKFVKVLQEDPELLATLREAMAVERAVPAELKKSRERADVLIAKARPNEEKEASKP